MPPKNAVRDANGIRRCSGRNHCRPRHLSVRDRDVRVAHSGVHINALSNDNVRQSDHVCAAFRVHIERISELRIVEGHFVSVAARVRNNATGQHAVNDTQRVVAITRVQNRLPAGCERRQFDFVVAESTRDTN